MSLEKTLLLGFIAGVTILLGLPVGRLQRPAPTLRMMLNAIAVGILLFLLWDVLSAAWEPIDIALSDFHAGNGGLASAAGYGVLFAGGFAVGLLALVAYENWMNRVTSVPGATRGSWPRGLRGGNSRCSLRSASGCTTSPRASRSARPPRTARSHWRRCSSSDSRCTTQPRASASSRPLRARRIPTERTRSRAGDSF